LCDMFVHGVGGADYERVTQQLLDEFFDARSLTYTVATATCEWRQQDMALLDDEAEITGQLRELTFHPERFLSEQLPADASIAKLIQSKRHWQLIAGNKQLPADDRRSAGILLGQINKTLGEHCQDVRDDLEKRLKRARDWAQQKPVVSDRGYFFGLFAEGRLRALCERS